MKISALTHDQRDFFEAEGYLLIDDVFTDAELQPVVDEITAEISERARALVESGELSRTFEEAGFEHQLTCISRETPAVAEAVWNGVLCGPAIFDLIRHPKLLDIAESFCGPELIGSSVYRLRPKIPNHPKGPVPWHQDSGYFEAYCDQALVLTVWLPLVDTTEENGCLWVLPRAHTGGIVQHYQGGQYLEINDRDLPHPEEAVCVEVKKGGILLLTNRTPHASYENRTDVTRWSMDLRYQDAALPTNADLSRSEKETSDLGEAPIACYPPEADFLVRSLRRPEEVVVDHSRFNAIRTEHQAVSVTPRWPKVDV
jgi:ectoine hydroxylase-related dioxygenase (phytanoyl-CoA dioxygenase family)